MDMETLTLTAEQISIDILNNHDSVRGYGICDDGEIFTNYSKKKRKNIRSFVRYYDRNKNPMIVCSTDNSAINLVMELIKRKAISRSDAREIVGEPCDKCSGLGFLTQYAHIENGLCFKCNGSGNK